MAEISHVNLSDLNLPEFQAHKNVPPQYIKEISESIKSIGVIEPLIVRKTKHGIEIVAGCIRYHAAKLAGQKAVPCLFVSLDHKASEILKLHENIKRIPLNHVDQGYTFLMMLNTFNMSEQNIADSVGKSVSYISQHISLVRLGADLIDYVRSGELPFSHARELIRLSNKSERKRLLSSCLESGVSFKYLQEWINNSLRNSSISPSQDSSTQDLSHSSESPKHSYSCEACHRPIKTSEITQAIFCPTCHHAILSAIAEERQELSSKTPENDSEDAPD